MLLSCSPVTAVTTTGTVVVLGIAILTLLLRPPVDAVSLWLVLVLLTVVWVREMLARGVYPPPSPFEAWFPSLAHTPEHLTRTLEAAAVAFAEVF